MVINDLDMPSFTVSPNETNAPLFVDANTVLPLALSLQGFQPIAGRYAQVIQSGSCLNDQELRPCMPLDPQGQVANSQTDEDGCRAFVGKALDHD